MRIQRLVVRIRRLRRSKHFWASASSLIVVFCLFQNCGSHQYVAAQFVANALPPSGIVPESSSIVTGTTSTGTGVFTGTGTGVFTSTGTGASTGTGTSATTSTAVVSLYAGTGTAGYSGDGGAATSAMLNHPYGGAIDSAGNIYVADTFNSVVRKVTPSGIISTFAGNGVYGFSGDGGAATSAKLSSPSAVAVDNSGNVYIADMDSVVIRKVNTSGVISTIAGTPGVNGNSGDGGAATSARMMPPFGVAVDSSGNVFIATPQSNSVRKVSSSGIMSTYAGNGSAAFSGDNGPAASASLDHPYSVAVDSNGNLYIADQVNRAIRMVAATNASSFGVMKTAGNIYTIGGVGGVLPYGCNNASYCIADGDSGIATSAHIGWTNGIAVDAAGNVYITDGYNQNVRMIANQTGVRFGMSLTIGFIYQVAGIGTGVGVSVDASGNLYTIDSAASVVYKVH